ncbi:MAG: MFS transporter, partial [Desulfatibacillum sp.]|nr:MFS transporter [Desulfatibacillum sp.]
MPDKAPFSVQALRLLLVCAIAMIAVSCVFMTQAIFLELAQSFQVEETKARLSFSIVSLFYGLFFLVVGPAADRLNQPRMAFFGALFLALAVLSASFIHNFSVFLVMMAVAGNAPKANT